MTIGQRVRLIRENAHLNGERFGEIIGLKKSAISRLENGTNSLTEQTLLSICREFDINEQWLRTGEGEMYNDQSDSLIMQVAEKYHLDSFQQKLLKRYLGLSDAQKAAVKDFLQGL